MTTDKVPGRFYSGNPRRLKVPKGSLHRCICGVTLSDPVKRDAYYCSKRCRRYVELIG